MKEDDEMWGSDEDGDEADGELKDTEDFDGDARRRLERWAVREFGVLGFAFNLGLSWSPIQACDGVSVWGLSKIMVMGLVGSPIPVALMKGLMPPVLLTLMAHTHSRIAHLATSFLNNFFFKKRRPLN